MKNLTRKQLFDATQNNRFILLRHNTHNIMYGHNCAVAKLSMFKNLEIDDSETAWSGFRPCSFQEYISEKIAFAVRPVTNRIINA